MSCASLFRNQTWQPSLIVPTWPGRHHSLRTACPGSGYTPCPDELKSKNKQAQEHGMWINVGYPATQKTKCISFLYNKLYIISILLWVSIILTPFPLFKLLSFPSLVMLPRKNHCQPWHIIPKPANATTHSISLYSLEATNRISFTYG